MIGVQVFGENELLDNVLKGKKLYSHCISIRNPEQEMHPLVREDFDEVPELPVVQDSGLLSGARLRRLS